MCQSHSSSAIPLVINKSRPRIEFIFIPLKEIPSACTILIISRRLWYCLLYSLPPAGPLSMDLSQNARKWEWKRAKSLVGLSGRQYPSPFSPSGGFNSISPALSDNWRFLRGDKNSLPAPLPVRLFRSVRRRQRLQFQTELSRAANKTLPFICATRTLQFASQIHGPGLLDNALLVHNLLIRRPSYCCGASSVIHLRQGRRHKGSNKASTFACKKILVT